jgi:hypothetical protein
VFEISDATWEGEDSYSWEKLAEYEEKQYEELHERLALLVELPDCLG